MKILKNVRENKDQYTIAEINCFEKPIAIALTKYDPFLSHLYYISLKMLQVYDVKGFCCQNYDAFPILSSIKEVMLRLGFSLEEAQIENSLSDVIMKEINNGHIVFVEGNLKELYYSKHYRTNNWNHLFLIKGYDQEREIYYINDASQLLSDEITYKDFILTFDIMNNMFQNNIRRTKSIYTLRQQNYNQCNRFKLMAEFLKPFLESRIIELLNEETQLLRLEEEFLTDQDKELIVNNLRKILINKRVLINEIILALRELNLEEQVEIINESANGVIKGWEVIINRTIRNIYRNVKEDIRLKIVRIKEVEERFHKSMSEIYNYLMHLSEINTHVGTKERDKLFQKGTFMSYEYKIENDDDIIHIRDRTIRFVFDKGKTYNSWEDDLSPKLLFEKAVDFSAQYEVTTKVRMINEKEYPYAMAGIVLKDSKNSIYFYGVSCGVKILFDICGINGNVVSQGINEGTVYLKIRIEGKKCSLMFASHIDPRIFRVIEELELKDEIVEFGIGCKTWGEYSVLSVEFSEIDIRNIS
ncbi:MAG: hypothetical protein ACLKAK_10800 [Alkaliphilus sp.]